MLSIFLTEELEREQSKREQSKKEHDQDTTTLYFFCTNGNENYNNAIAVLRGLAYQLLSKHPDISTSVSQYFETAKRTENTLTSPETLWVVFKTLLRVPKLGTIYCILDGLDECDGKSIGILVKQFRDFYAPSDHTGTIAQNLKLAIVSRKINGLEDFPQIRLDPDNDNCINEDIQRFISTAIRELSRRPGYDDYFLKDIENILLRRSKGTFLWIGFVMKELLDMSTRMEIMDVLNALPQGLPAMYGRMLRQIKSSQRHIILAILKCVTIARRPMTLEELKTAVSLLCNTPIDSTQSMRGRIASCGPILQISEEQDTCTCSLVHQSARDYLLREEADEDPTAKEFRIKEKEAHTSLARICLACIENTPLWVMDASVLEESLYASVLEKSPLLGYATKHWPEHVRHADEDLDFSKTFFQGKHEVWKHWWQAYKHIAALKWDTYLRIGTRPLDIASYLGVNPLVRKILHGNAWRVNLKFQKYVNQRNADDMTPLILAAGEGHHGVVQLLLAKGADVNMSGGDFHRYSHSSDFTALEAAAARGHLIVVQLLLANGADAKLPGNDKALHYAAGNGHEAVVQLLLNKGIDVNSTPPESTGYQPNETALNRAARNGHEAIVRLLLANGANPNIKSDTENTPLHRAAWGGHEAIIQLLLANGADVNEKDYYGRHALQIAVIGGYEAIVQLLLAHDADVSMTLKDYLENTALQEVVWGGHTAIVQLLLNLNDARYVSTEESSRAALDWAVRRGHKDIVQLLLANGVSRTDVVKGLG